MSFRIESGERGLPDSRRAVQVDEGSHWTWRHGRSISCFVGVTAWRPGSCASTSTRSCGCGPSSYRTLRRNSVSCTTRGGVFARSLIPCPVNPSTSRLTTLRTITRGGSWMNHQTRTPSSTSTCARSVTSAGPRPELPDDDGGCDGRRPSPTATDARSTCLPGRGTAPGRRPGNDDELEGRRLVISAAACPRRWTGVQRRPDA